MVCFNDWQIREEGKASRLDKFLFWCRIIENLSYMFQLNMSESVRYVLGNAHVRSWRPGLGPGNPRSGYGTGFPFYPILSLSILRFSVLCWSNLLYPVVLCSILLCFILSYIIPLYPVVSILAVFFCLFHSIFILSYPNLSYPIPSHPIPSYPILSYPILSYLILSYLILPHLISSHLISSYLMNLWSVLFFFSFSSFLENKTSCNHCSPYWSFSRLLSSFLNRQYNHEYPQFFPPDPNHLPSQVSPF